MTVPAAPAHPALVLPVLALAGTVSALVQTLVLPLLPHFTEWLSVGSAEAQWIATSTMLAGAVAAPFFGRLGDRFGYGRMLVWSLGLLAAGSAISAMSTDLAGMLAGRTLQGLSAGVLPLGFAIVASLLPSPRVPLAIGVVSGTVGVGTALGVPLAGLLLQLGPWQLVFWLTAALAALGIVGVLVAVPHEPPPRRDAFDLAGAVGFATVLVLLVLPLSLAGESGLDDPRTAGSLIAAAVLGALWLRHQWRAPHPFVDIRRAIEPLALGTHLVAFLVGITFFLSFTGTVYLTQSAAEGAGLGGDVLLTGIVQTPASLVSIAAGPLAAVVALRVGPRRALLWAVAAVALSSMLRMPVLDEIVTVTVCAALLSGSASFVYSVLPLVLVGDGDDGAALGLNAMMRQVGAGVGSALAIVILGPTLAVADLGSDSGLGPGAFHALFGSGALIAAAGAVALALVLRRARSATHPLPVHRLADPIERIHQ